jgi:hypothetical protein
MSSFVLSPEDEALVSTLPSEVEDSCFARVGLMGNPSDGFKGKTLSFLIENFKATVHISARSVEHGVEIAEPVMFSDMDHLVEHSQKIVRTIGSPCYCHALNLIVLVSNNLLLTGIY